MAAWFVWHSERMGKEIDPIRAKSALAVVKQNPGIALFAVSPLIVLVAIVWVFAGTGWGIGAPLALLADCGVDGPICKTPPLEHRQEFVEHNTAPFYPEDRQQNPRAQL